MKQRSTKHPFKNNRVVTACKLNLRQCKLRLYQHERLRLMLMTGALLLLHACSHVQCHTCITLKIPLNSQETNSHPDANPNSYTLFELNAAVKIAPSTRWHIYLEGDGNPWHKGLWPNTNPNSRQQLALQLMNLDDNASIYLQRPCYGYAGTPPAPCKPELWTSARYSETIVAALNQALDTLQDRYGNKPLVFIGHSGGGTLAMLLAQRRSDVAGVITIAGNLDPDAWTNNHHYLPLNESLNPSTAPLLTPHVFRWHLIGTEDTVIPEAISRQAVAKDPWAHLRVYPFGHHKGWKKLWPMILNDVSLLPNADEVD